MANKNLPWILGGVGLVGLLALIGSRSAGASNLPPARSTPRKPGDAIAPIPTPENPLPERPIPAMPDSAFRIPESNFYHVSESMAADSGFDILMVKQAIRNRIGAFGEGVVITYNPYSRVKTSLPLYVRWDGFKALVEVFDVPDALAWTAEAFHQGKRIGTLDARDGVMGWGVDDPEFRVAAFTQQVNWWLEGYGGWAKGL